MEIDGIEVKGFNVYSNEWGTFTAHDSIVAVMGNDADEAQPSPSRQGRRARKSGRLRGGASTWHLRTHGGQARMSGPPGSHASLARTGDGRQRTERTSGSPGARPPSCSSSSSRADPAGRGMLALSHEVARISGALAAGVHCVTWPADPPADVGAVADALAGLVRTSCRPSSSWTPT